MKLGLENIRTLLTELGDPHEKYLKVQVAGTNGKGSVCAFLDSICRQADIRTGLYTSPHLVSITERIKIDGADISEKEFAHLATRVRETAERLFADGKLTYTPTYFEQVTAIGLLAFAEAKVELAILEAGLGGRLDATTATNAEIAAITQIDLDHQEYLGETIEEIAAEKAAIIRPHTRAVVIGPQDKRAIDVIEARIRDVDLSQTSLFVVGRDRANLKLVSPPDRLGLRGKHQIENAEIAVGIAKAVRDYFTISDDAIRKGLAAGRHPGRLEYIGCFLLDGAHNPAGAKALRNYLHEYEKRPVTMIFGAMGDKDVAEIAAILWPRAETVILTRASNIRALTADDLTSAAPADFNRAKIVETESVAEALEEARAIMPPKGIILVTGSLYLVGEVKKLINN